MSATQTKQPQTPGRRATAGAAATASSKPWAPVRRRRWFVPLLAVASLVVLGFGLRAVVTGTASTDESLVYYTVRRGTLPIAVTERGNLESQKTEQIICEVEKDRKSVV